MPDFAHYIPNKNYTKLHKTIQTRQRIIGKETKDFQLKGPEKDKGAQVYERKGFAL